MNSKGLDKRLCEHTELFIQIATNMHSTSAILVHAVVCFVYNII